MPLQQAAAADVADDFVARRQPLQVLPPVGPDALGHYDELKGLDRSRLSMDGAMTKVPLGRKKTGPNPTDRGKVGVKRSVLSEADGVPAGLAVEGANRHDMKLVRATVDSMPVSRPEPGPEQPRGAVLGQGV